MTLRGGLAALVTSAVLTLHASLGAAQTVERGLATPLEQALIERTCTGPVAGAAQVGGYDECVHTQLDAMREDFGRDLSRLSSADRRAIDSACAPVRAAQGRDGYVNCMASQLAAIKSRMNRAHASANTPAASDSAPAAANTASANASNPPAVASLTSLMFEIAATAAVGCGALLALRLRRLRHACKMCGARIGNDGDLCATCRHQAAEALRRTAAERIEQQRAQENEVRRQREHEDEARQRVAREAEETRLHQLELARRREEEAAEEARRRDAEEAADRARQAVTDAAAPAFDPFVVLGVPRDATIDAVRLAYEQARTKYDLEQVEGLGSDVREHYAAKAEAAERAYQILAEALSAPEPRRDQAPPEPLHEQAPHHDPHQVSEPLEVSS